MPQAANVGVSMSAYLPTLSAQGSESRNFQTLQERTPVTTSKRKPDAGYLLFDFGGRSATLENAKQLLVAANATRDATLQTNFLTAVQSYYALLSARASVDALKVAELRPKKAWLQLKHVTRPALRRPADKLQAQTALSQARLN